MKKLLLMILAVAGYVGTASATDYYIGANTGDNGNSWEIQGQMIDEDNDGTYSLIISIPKKEWVSDNLQYFDQLYFTICTSSEFNWNNVFRPKNVAENTDFVITNNESGNEVEMSEESSTKTGTINYPNSWQDSQYKNYASAIKIDYTPTTHILKVTRLISVISGYNGWSKSIDYLTETSNGSKIYTGAVTLENESTGDDGFKFYIHNDGWENYCGKGNDGKINNSAGNVTVDKDGVYILTAQLTDWAWTDPTFVTVTASAGTYGMATLSSEYALDFTGITGVAAYTITRADKATGELTKTPVTGKVKAGTGLYIEGNQGASAVIPTTICTEEATGNMLVAATTEKTIPQVDDTYTNYILTVNKAGGNNVDTPKFFKVNTAGNTVLAGKAYLQIPTTEAARMSFWFNDSVSAIEGVEQASMDGPVYNVAGQRVAQPVKGLYIANGKKFIKK